MKSPSSLACDGKAVNGLLPIDAVANMIRAGACLSLAGRKGALDKLPAGQWIAGTSPYFMTPDGGRIVNEDEIFVTDLSAIGAVSLASCGPRELASISGQAPEHGLALAVIPAGSACHVEFAKNAAAYPMAFMRPTVGWIAGYDLAETGACALVYDGRTRQAHTDRAVVAHIALADEVDPAIEIVNIFAPDGGPVIRFEETGFTPKWCTVDGELRRFAEYVAECGRGGGDLPLVGDFAGAHLNASIKTLDAENGTVELYAPVFPGVDYAFAAPVADYAAEFRKALAARPGEGAVWSCNCILNFLFGRMEGVAIGGLAGPVTFGEIAYQLLNQTMVVVRKG